MITDIVEGTLGAAHGLICTVRGSSAGHGLGARVVGALGVAEVLAVVGLGHLDSGWSGTSTAWGRTRSESLIEVEIVEVHRDDASDDVQDGL